MRHQNPASSPNDAYLLAETEAPESLRELFHRIHPPYGSQIPCVLGRQIAAHPNLPLDLLVEAISIYPAEFLTNPILPLLLLEMPDIFDTLSSEAMLGLLRFPNVPASILNLLVVNRHKVVASAATYHVALSPDHHSFPADLEERWMEYAAAVFRELPPFPDTVVIQEFTDIGFTASGPMDSRNQHLRGERLVRDILSFRALLPIPFSPSQPLPTPQWLLRTQPDNMPELAEAMDERTTTSRLTALNEIADTFLPFQRMALRNALSLHPNADEELQWAICTKETTSHIGLAMNPSLSYDMIVLLAGSPSRLVRRLIRAHPTVLADLHLREEVHAAARIFVCQHMEKQGWKGFLTSDHELPTAFHARFGKPEWRYICDPYWLVRLAVALNPLLRDDVRESLAEDGCRLVRAAARARLAEPEALFGV